MVNMEDEFGDLYADIEVQVSSSTIDARFSRIEDENKKSLESNGNEYQKENLNESNILEEEEAALVSDSEDDFRIVLNDDDNEDCCTRANPTDDFYVNTDGPSKDNRQLEQSDRGNDINTNYYSQHSPYYYNKDANGCYQQPVSSSRGTHCSAIGQTGCDFSLPWHKTITDINIDAFQQKPWKHPGVDTTDYFNFGLDEESWKHYCNSLEQLRQQTGLMSKTNKTHRAGFGHQTVGGESSQIEKGVSPVQNYAIKLKGGLDIPKGRAIQVDSGTGERRPSMDIWRPQNRDSDVVIQISVHNNTECSSSSCKEELGDSDRSKLNVFENGGSGIDLTQSVFSNDRTNECIRRQFCETYDRDGGLFLLKRCSGRDVTSDALVTDPDSKGNAEIPDTKKERISEGSFEVINYRKEQIPSNRSVKDSFRLEPEPLLGDQFWCASSLSYSDSHDGSGSSKENTHKPARRSFPNSDIELRAPLTLECCESMESESNAGKTGLGDTNDDSRNESHLKGEDSCSRIRLRSVAETTYHVSDGVVTQFNGEDWFGGKSLIRNSCKRRKRQYKNNYYDGNCLPDYRETEIAFNYHHKTFAGKPVRDASTEHIRAEGRTESRTEMDTSLKGCLDEREYFVEKTLTRRENKARQSDHLLSQRNYTNRRLNGAIHGESACFTSDCSPICTGTKKYRGQRKKEEEKCFRRVTEEDDTMIEHRYREQYIDESCVRSVPYYEREWKYLNKNHDRHISYKYPYWRDRHGGSPCMDIVTDTPCKVRSGRRRVNGSFSSHREYDITSERGWHDGASLTPVMHDLRRLDRVDMGPWRQRRYKKHQNTRWFARTHRNGPDSVSVICPDDYFSNDGRGNIRQCEPLDWPEDGIHSKIKNHDSTYAHEASFSHEQHSIHGDFRIKNYASSHCRMVFDENRPVPDRNTKVREVVRDSVVSTHIISSFDLVEKYMDEQAAPRHRKSVDLHFVDLDEKVSGKFSKTGGTMSNGGKQASESSVFRKHKCSESSKNVYSGKVTALDKSKVEINASNGFVSKIEKVSDHDFETPPFKNYHGEKKEVILQEATGHSMKTESYATHGKEVLLRDAVEENMTVGAFDNHRILESLAKMVKRRERFKEPIVAKELYTTTKSVVTDTVVEPTESKQQQRPIRRRRWGGS